MFRFLASVILAASLFFGPAIAGTVDSDLPPIDPPDHWHSVGQTADKTTSTCIGRPKTPLCAVENILACLSRVDKKLCRLATLPGDHFWKGVRKTGDYYRYRVVAARRLTAPGITQWEKDWADYRCEDMISEAHPRDITLDVREVKNWYSLPERADDPDLVPLTYLTRKVSRRQWRVVSWCAPRSRS